MAAKTPTRMAIEVGPAPPPPPIRRDRRRVVLIACAGLLTAVMLVVVAFQIDPKPDSSTQNQSQSQPELNIVPRELSAQDMSNSVRPAGIGPQFVGAERAWIQVTRPDGSLEKQYRFAALDPLPEGRSRMRAPEIESYLRNGRVLTLSSESASVVMPAKSPESGTMSGSVIIRLYEPLPGTTFNRKTSTLTLEIRTDQASFDNVRGEVRCEGVVDIQTASLHVVGRDLRLLINELSDRIEWLKMGYAEVRLARLAGEDRAEPRDESSRSSDSRKGRRSVTSDTQSTQPAVTNSPTFYRMTFQDNVRIRQGQGPESWLATGDELSIVISMQSKQIETSFAVAHDVPAVIGASVGNKFAAILTSAVLGSVGEDVSVAEVAAALFKPADDDITINCDKGLTMTPLADASEQPAFADDARIELIGRPVQIQRESDRIGIACRALTYSTLSQRIDLTGDAQSPLSFDSPELLAGGGAIWINQKENIGAIEGPGWMINRKRIDVAGPSSVQPEENLKIEWQNRVDLAFYPGGESNQSNSIRLRSAAFAGSVHAANADIALGSDTLTVNLPDVNGNGDPSRPPRPGIESIEAAGSVIARSFGDQGSIAGDNLRVEFDQSADGRAIPRLMRVRQHVVATDRDNQKVWTDDLDIQFKPLADAKSEKGQTSSRSMPAVRAKSLTATGHVQVLTADGSRAFADLMQGDPVNGSAVLTGTDVIIVSDRAAIHRGTRLELSKEKSTATWPGAGEFVYFASALTQNSSDAIERPQLENLAQSANAVHMRANWSESMAFDGTVNDGAGAITLVGAVRAESTQSQLEVNTVDGHKLMLQFVKAKGDETADASQSSSALNTGRRQLEQFTVEGKADAVAKIESRSWLKFDRSDSPRMFYIAGPRIAYNDQTFEASVDQAGELLVRDERIETDPARKSGKSTLSSKGATSFRWSGHLRMTRRTATISDIEMVGDVRVIHRSLDQSITILTSPRLEASVERSARRTDRASTIDLGGSMSLQRVRASGGVYIDSPSRDVECDEFDYDYTTSLATLSAEPPRRVTTIAAGSGEPVHAQRAVWNLAEDKITLSDISGSTNR